MELTHQLTPMLRTLRLSGILETLDVRNRQAVEQPTSFVEFLTVLLQDEVERRAQSKLRLRLRRTAFDPTKTLEGFDFSFNPKLNKAQVFDLATCQFIERHENALLYGATGVGKSHLGQAAVAFAWLYKQTGDTTYRDRADAIFAAGVTGACASCDGKHFSQQYRWSFDYVKWRNPSAIPAAPSGLLVR